MPPAPQPVQQAAPTPAQLAQPTAPSSESIAAAVARAEMFTGNIQRQQSARPTPQQPAPAAQQVAQPVEQTPPPQPAGHEDPNESIPWQRLSRIAEMHRQRKTGTADGGRQTVDGGRQTVDGGRQTVDGGRQTADSKQSSVVSKQSSVVSKQSSVVSKQSSVVSNQSSVVSNQSSAVSGQPSAVSGQPSAVSGQPSTPQRQVPLEAAWPVQREPQAKPEAAAQSGRPEAAAQEPLQRTPQDKETEEQLRARLESVKAARSSDSSVELHLPRRPRPTLPGAGQQAEAPKQPQQQTPPVQRQPEQQPQTVPTEIGPLPADMWELLDQSPPTTKQSNEPTVQPSDQPTNEPSNDPGNSPAASVQRAIDAAEQKAAATAGPVGDTPPVAPEQQQRPPQQTPESDQLSVDSGRQTTDGGRRAIDGNQSPVASNQSSAVGGQPSAVSRQRSTRSESPSLPQQQPTDPHFSTNEAPEASLPRQSSTVNEPRPQVAPESTPQLQRQEASQPAPEPTPATDEPHTAQLDELPPQPTQTAPAGGEAIARAIAAAEQPAAPEPSSRQHPAEQPQKTGQPPQPGSTPSEPKATHSSQPVQRTSQPEAARQVPATGNWEHSAVTRPLAAVPQRPAPETPATPTSKQQLSAPQEASPVQRAPKVPATPETPAPDVQTDVARRSSAEAGYKSPETAETPPAPAVTPAANPDQHFESEPTAQRDESDLTDAPTVQSGTPQASKSAPVAPGSPAIQQQPEDSAPLTPEAADEETIARAIAAAEAPPSPDTPPAPARPEAKRAPGGPPASLPATTGDQDGRGPTNSAVTPASQHQTPIPRRPATQTTFQPSNHPTIQPSNHAPEPVVARLLAEPQARTIPPHHNTLVNQPATQPANEAPVQSPISNQPESDIELASGEQPAQSQPSIPFHPVIARLTTPGAPAAAAPAIRRQSASYPQTEPFQPTSSASFGEHSAWTVSQFPQTETATTITPALQRTADYDTAAAIERIEQSDNDIYSAATTGAKAPTTNQKPTVGSTPLTEPISPVQRGAETAGSTTDLRASQPSNQPAKQRNGQDVILSNKESASIGDHLRQENSQISNHRVSNIQRAIAAAERSTPRPSAPEVPANEALAQRAQVTMGDEQEDDDWNLPQLFSGPDDATPQVQENKPENEAPEEPQIDIEELAQRVYNDLRRRLTVDWERERGRR